MTSNPSNDRWLLRTAANRISGPYTRQEICQMIQQGKLQLNDEVCNANRYWFYLHENEEIKKQLQIDLPKQLYSSPEEPTQTETDTDITDLTTMHSPQRNEPRMGTKPEADELPELSQAIDEIGENTAVMSNRAFRQFRQKKSEPFQQPTPQAVHVVTPEHPVPGRLPEKKVVVERSKLVQFATYFMMLAAVGLLVAVILLLRQSP